MTNRQIDKAAWLAVSGIVRDLTDRRGLRQAWEGIDQDIREEIVAVWQEAVRKAIREASAP